MKEMSYSCCGIVFTGRGGGDVGGHNRNGRAPHEAVAGTGDLGRTTPTFAHNGLRFGGGIPFLKCEAFGRYRAVDPVFSDLPSSTLMESR